MSTAQPTFDDVWRMFQELGEQSRETDRKFQETDRLFKAQAEETKRLQELFESQWGRLMESLVEGDLVNILKCRGIAVLDTSTRLKGKTSAGGNYEFDILAHNGDELVVTEVKTTLRPKDVEHFIGRLDKFKVWLPRYANNRIYGAVAYLTADAAADTMAEKRGLFVIRATGDSASIINAKDFLPRGW